VRKKHEIDIANVQILLPECIKQQRNAAVDARIDERGSAAFGDQVAGVLQRARVFGVDGGNAIVELDCLRAQSLLRFGCLESVEARVIFREQHDIIITEGHGQRRHNRVFARAITILIQ